MRDQATYRIGLAMAAGALLAGCAQTGPSTSAPAASPAPPAPSLTTPSGTAPASASPEVQPSRSTESTKPAPTKTRPTDPDALPTIDKTAKPPKEPTDQMPTTGWVAGMVTRGGTGPCYGLIADDGMRYALYNSTGIELTKGARVKVHLETTTLRIYCGVGTLMAMTDSEPIQ